MRLYKRNKPDGNDFGLSAAHNALSLVLSKRVNNSRSKATGSPETASGDPNDLDR